MESTIGHYERSGTGRPPFGGDIYCGAPASLRDSSFSPDKVHSPYLLFAAGFWPEQVSGVFFAVEVPLGGLESAVGYWTRRNPR
ncbi:hypothetical protein [Nitrosococcus wardiae]|uniref:Uncharacterized protein n=1 Tax=Nitrosococcus wardiae TaxID=1814290 RepID=A0A4P7C0B0_9GAMM|nr:hypothetical protein [Nitrosococcus wardiae]QBQ55973.1 hypothetical protein E3U44_16735 [Nitrosococcus wardiae]